MMLIRQQINDTIQMLQEAEQASSAPKTLRERIIAAGQAKFLSEIQKITPDAPDASEQVKKLLTDHWESSKDTPFMYTAMPQSALTHACSALAVAVSDTILSREESLSCLDILMPGLVTESMVDGYPDLIEPKANKQAWLEGVLSTHITRKGGGCLIPVNLLTSEPGEDKLPNPYTDMASDSHDAYYVSNEEQVRLKEHSTFTQAIRDTEASLQTIQSGQTSLLGRLNRFLSLLSLYSAHGGLGEEANAAGGAYPAIIDFMEYYQALPEATKARIPSAVKQQIDLIFNLSSDATKNINATAQLETCTATRRTELRKAVVANEQALALIGASKEERGENIAKARQDLTAARGALKNAIENQTYRGHDSAPISPNLLYQFNLTFVIEGEADFEEIFRLSPDEIKAICADKEIKSQIMGYLRQDGTGVEKLVISAISAAPEKFAAFLGQMKAELTQGENPLLGGAKNLSALLVSLDEERIQYICQTIGSDTIKRASDFRTALEHLSLEQRTIVFDAMEGKLLNFIKSVYDFRDVVEFLAPEQRTIVFDAMEGKLLKLIRSGRNLGAVLEYLTPEQRTSLFNEMGGVPKLFGFIKNAFDFNKIMECLSSEQRTSLFNEMGGALELSKLIESADDFKRVMEYLNPEQRTHVFEMMKGRLPTLSAREFDTLVECLNYEQRTHVFEMMKDEFEDIINDVSEEEQVRMVKMLIINDLMPVDVMLSVAYQQKKTFLLDELSKHLSITDDALLKACEHGQAHIAKFLIKEGVEPTEELLHDMISAKKIEVLLTFIEEKVVAPGAILAFAYRQENIDVIKALIPNKLRPSEAMLAKACQDEKVEVIKLLLDNKITPTKEIFRDIISAKKITAIHTLIDEKAVNPNDIYKSAYYHGNIDVMKALIPDRVKPTEAMFSKACKDGKLEIAQFFAEQLIPDIVKPKHGENLSGHVIPQLVQAINKNNLPSLAKTGLHNFVSNQLDQPESNKNSTSAFKTRFNEVTKGNEDVNDKEEPRSPNNT
jgi:hypothetical protein